MKPYFDTPLPIAFAHRGGAATRPENTLVAFRHAIDLGFRYIETDVHLTRDGHLVCFHDDTLERTTDGKGRVRDYSLEELRRLDAGCRFAGDQNDYPFRGEGVTIPTLEEAMSLDETTRFNIEIKPSEPAAIRAVWEFISHHGVEDRVLIAAENDETGKHFQRFAKGRVATSPGFGGALLFWAQSRLAWPMRKILPYDALQLPPTYRGLRVVDERLLARAHALGIQVHVWTIDEPDEMWRLIELGVDGVMTDRPTRLLDVLQRQVGQR